MNVNKEGTAKSMKNYIRFSGLIGFFTVMLVVVFLLYLFAETLIKSTIEQVAGTSLGAEVNVASIELQYSPLVLTINGLEATDAELPTHNLFSVQRAEAGVDLWQYLLGKTIIEQLNVEQLELSTKRSHIGEVYEQSLRKQAQALTGEIALPAMDLELPDVKTIINDSNLLTVKSAAQLQKSYDEEKLKLNALKEKLPSEEKLAAYKNKIQNISKMKVKNLEDFNKVKAAFDSIKKEFSTDQVIVKSAKEQLFASKQRILDNVTTLKSSPGKDWQAIENKYQLGSVNTEDFAHILFGEKARGYYQKAESIYQRLAPFLNNSQNASQDKATPLSAKGRFIHFDEDAPLPEFLIKQASFSLVLEQGDFEVTAQELTHQHWYRNKASKVTISSTKLVNEGDVRVDGQFKLAKNGDASGQGQWLIKQLTVKDVPLSESSSLALTLVEGKLSGTGDFVVNQGNQIDSKNNFSLTEANYQSEADTKLAVILLDTIKSLDKLTLGVSAEGKLDAPSWNISSSLDDAVKGAFKKQITNKLSEFKVQVSSGLNEKLAQSLNVGEQKNAELINFETLLGDTDNTLEQLKNSDVVKQQQKKLQDKTKDKLQDKLKGKLGDLFG